MVPQTQRILKTKMNENQSFQKVEYKDFGIFSTKDNTYSCLNERIYSQIYSILIVNIYNGDWELGKLKEQFNLIGSLKFPPLNSFPNHRFILCSRTNL